MYNSKGYLLKELITPNRRLEAIRALVKKDKKTFVKEIGVKYFTYNEVIQERKPVPAEWVNFLYTKYNVHPNWIILGKGDIFC